MPVRYLPFGDDRVSEPWHAVLTAAVRAGAIAERDLTSGRRSMAEQQELVDRKGIWSPSNPTGAARPSPTAPHIRVGRADHAIDVNALNGAAGRLAGWLRKRGARARFTVPGEPWHIEVPAADLTRLARDLQQDPLRGYTTAERRWIREYDALKRAGRDRRRRRVLRRYMTRQRKRVWRAAQGPGGWTAHHRAARYRSLRARTR
jgi:hypothetical protein